MDEEFPNDTEVVVIGGGPAGYAAAIRAAQLDTDVVMVERDAYGGTCLNHGCIPSKALIAATDVADRAANGDHMGISAEPTIDLPRMMQWKDQVVTRLSRGVEHLCRQNGVTLLEGTAAFVDDDRVRMSLGEDECTIGFETAIVATGSTAVALPELPFEEPGILDARQALSLDAVPTALAIVGAGYIGMELAGVFAKLGSDVTVIELLGGALPRYDDELVAPVLKRADRNGIDCYFESRVTDYRRTRDERLELTVDGEAAPESVAVDQVLVAVGRRPVTATVNLEAVDLEPAEDGSIPVNQQGQTSNPQVYAVGDVTGDPMLAHAGIAEGVATAEVIANGHATERPTLVPEVVFTDPEIARVGMREVDAVNAGYTPKVSSVPLRANGRALTLDRRDGFVRLVADESSGQLLGGAIVGPHAGELIGEIGLAIELEATLEALESVVHPHPTVSEAVGEAASFGLERAIHVLNSECATGSGRVRR